jgi:hypothetical protein
MLRRDKDEPTFFASIESVAPAMKSGFVYTLIKCEVKP